MTEPTGTSPTPPEPLNLRELDTDFSKRLVVGKKNGKKVAYIKEKSIWDRLFRTTDFKDIVEYYHKDANAVIPQGLTQKIQDYNSTHKKQISSEVLDAIKSRESKTESPRKEANTEVLHEWLTGGQKKRLIVAKNMAGAKQLFLKEKSIWDIFRSSFKEIISFCNQKVLGADGFFQAVAQLYQPKNKKAQDDLQRLYIREMSAKLKVFNEQLRNSEDVNTKLLVELQKFAQTNPLLESPLFVLLNKKELSEKDKQLVDHLFANCTIQQLNIKQVVQPMLEHALSSPNSYIVEQFLAKDPRILLKEKNMIGRPYLFKMADKKPLSEHELAWIKKTIGNMSAKDLLTPYTPVLPQHLHHKEKEENIFTIAIQQKHEALLEALCNRFVQQEFDPILWMQFCNQPIPDTFVEKMLPILAKGRAIPQRIAQNTVPPTMDALHKAFLLEAFFPVESMKVLFSKMQQFPFTEKSIELFFKLTKTEKNVPELLQEIESCYREIMKSPKKELFTPFEAFRTSFITKHLLPNIQQLPQNAYRQMQDGWKLLQGKKHTYILAPRVIGEGGSKRTMIAFQTSLKRPTDAPRPVVHQFAGGDKTSLDNEVAISLRLKKEKAPGTQPIKSYRVLTKTKNEYCVGICADLCHGNLGDLLRSENAEERMKPQSVLKHMKLFKEVLTGVQSLHHRGILHLDLKPANMLVTRDDAGEPHVNIYDFGTSLDLTQKRTQRLNGLLTDGYACTPEYSTPYLQKVRAQGKISLNDLLKEKINPYLADTQSLCMILRELYDAKSFEWMSAFRSAYSQHQSVSSVNFEQAIQDEIDTPIRELEQEKNKTPEQQAKLIVYKLMKEILNEAPQKGTPIDAIIAKTDEALKALEAVATV